MTGHLARHSQLFHIRLLANRKTEAPRGKSGRNFAAFSPSPLRPPRRNSDSEIVHDKATILGLVDQEEYMRGFIGRECARLSAIATLSSLALLGVGCTDRLTGPPAAPSHPSFDPNDPLFDRTSDSDEEEEGGQSIAFASDRVGFFQVFVMRPNGRQPTQLTNVPFYNARPNWSHDGRRITFTACRQGESCEIYVMNADGSGQVNLTNNFSDEQMSVWSPDDEKIAFVSNRDGNNEIYVMNADGSDPTRLTYDYVGVNDQLPSWSPDGRKIAFVSNRDFNDEIYVMNADGSNPVNLSRNPAGDAFPSWSPRGDRIAFRSDRDGNEEIYAMRADGRNPTRLTNNPAADYYPAWSPSGNKIAFVSFRDGNGEIYVMNANGSRQRRVTDNPAFDGDPAWGKPAGGDDD
jgi:Tol biopolymer transport system component